jgi:hypothetical protein
VPIVLPATAEDKAAGAGKDAIALFHNDKPVAILRKVGVDVWLDVDPMAIVRVAKLRLSLVITVEAYGKTRKKSKQNKSVSKIRK